MNFMYKVTNMRESQQVEGGIITSVKADIWGSEQDKNTLISFPQALQPSAARFFLTLDQTISASLVSVSAHLLSSWASFLIMLKTLEK